MTELKPCPFCGSADVGFDRLSESMFDVTCWSCNAGRGITYGPEADSKEAAALAWNTRQPAATDAVASAMLTDQMRADGWIEHDGGKKPFSGFAYFLWQDGSVSWNHSDNFTRCWDWRPRWWRTLPPHRIIAYKPEPSHD